MRVPAGIRRITDRLLEAVPIRIVAGPNRGRMWSLVSAGSGHWSGRKEAARLLLIDRLVRPGDVVWDVGAHHGYVTLLSAARALPGGEVHAFEPSSRNRRLLERHLAWNHVTNVRVHPFALAGADGTATFGGPGTSKTLSLGGAGGGGEQVEVRSAKSVVAEGRCPPPSVFKIDVEGAEAEVLEGAAGVVPPEACMLVALHSSELHARCAALARAMGFEVLASRSLEAALAGPWRGDPDMLCLGARRASRAQDAAALRDSGL
jgi:FkbM family methyltransferase